MELNQDTVAELVATKLANEYQFRHLVGESLESIVHKRVEQEIKDHANAVLKEAADAAFANWRDIKLYRTNQWGETKGDPVSLPQWCEDQIITKAQQPYGGKSEISKQAAEVVVALVTKEVSELLKQQRAALNEIVNQTLAAEIAKRVAR